MATKQARTAALKIMVHPDMLAKLRQLGDILGQAPSTLASVAVSQYVAQQMRTISAGEQAVSELVKQTAPELVQQLRLLGSDKS